MSIYTGPVFAMAAQQFEGIAEFGAHGLGNEDRNTVRACQRLHPRGQVHGATDETIFAAFARADHARQPRAAMDADAQCQWR